MGKLLGKTALITGSDSGIGKAIAIEFASEGADIVITYHTDEDGAKDTLKEVEEKGRKGIVFQVDVSEEQEVEQLFDKALKEFETIDILVNNAGINGDKTTVAEISTEDFNKVMKTNFYGPFYATRRFLNIRKGKKNGKIINISSVHEEIPHDGYTAYNCSKGALRNFTRSVVLEVGAEGININNIAPGMILTPMNQKAIDNPEVRKKAENDIPMKRAAKPEEVAKVALFLASSDSDYVNGSTYVVDGGLMQNTGHA